MKYVAMTRRRSNSPSSASTAVPTAHRDTVETAEPEGLGHTSTGAVVALKPGAFGGAEDLGAALADAEALAMALRRFFIEASRIGSSVRPSDMKSCVEASLIRVPVGGDLL